MDHDLAVKSNIVSIAPGRICLFGDHQDYLGLPIIACAINKHITLTATKNNRRLFIIKMPDINLERIIDLDNDIIQVVKGDHFLSALKVLKRYNCVPNFGYDITIVGELPINAGTSSSSAVVISWVQFLLEAFGPKHLATRATISQIAYEAEVVEHGAPGGKMDHYSIGIGSVIFLETGDDFAFQIFDRPISGLIIGESGIPKETIGLLGDLKEKTWLAIHSVKAELRDFELKSANWADLKRYLNYVPDRLQNYFKAAITNHDITKKALAELSKNEPDYQTIGKLMTEHHNVLKNLLRITVPKIDKMVNAALGAGAFGVKIVGSGGGGCIVALAPKGKEQQVIDAIINAGGKNAYQVEVDLGARIVKSEEVINQ